VFSRFFIDRPIFASVMSILITLVGGLAIWSLPLSQFPRIAPPMVQVMATFPGASAEDVAQSVAAPIEQEVNGVEGMMYMSSQCTNDGAYNLSVTFKQGFNLDLAQVLVQNRVNLAMPRLPEVIKAAGVTTRKRTPDILMGIALYSPGGRYDQLYLSNYALRMIRDELSRVEGVSDVFLFGQRDYSMRIWLDPDKLAVRGMTAMDVVNAVREQNNQIATGMIGQQPAPQGQEIQVTLDIQGRLKSVQQFEDIILRAYPDGRVLRVKDIGRVELDSKSYDTTSKIDGMGDVFLAVFQLPDANALATSERVLDKMAELKQAFPDDVDYMMAFDTTPYTRESINNVFKTLLEAIILVAIVVLLFLQNWRSSIIPLVAVPVAIIGTFAVMALLGFSLNNLTLFGLVLAIGIVVDDAIVVVEAVEHHIENGLSPRDATILAMKQVSGPVIAVALVLSAVFIPCAFVSGITGLFFRQFALTISASTIISAFNSLTLSPALTALLLRSRDKETAPPLPRLAFPLAGGLLAFFNFSPWLEGELAWLTRNYDLGFVADIQGWLVPVVSIGSAALVAWILGKPFNILLRWLIQGFNRGFELATKLYTHAVSSLLHWCVPALVTYGVLLALTWLAYTHTPRGFIPEQDMGTLYVSVQLPDAASLERTQELMDQLSEMGRVDPGVKHITAIAGLSFALNANGSNFGSMFVNLKDFGERHDPDMHADEIAKRLRTIWAPIMEADINVFGPPAIKGVGRTGGFTIMIEDRQDYGPAFLEEQVDSLIDEAKKNPAITKLITAFRANVPQLRFTPDFTQVKNRYVSVQDFADTMRIYQGSFYVNDFNLFDRTWQVNIQADAQFRDNPKHLWRLAVRNKHGNMVPLGSMAGFREENGPLVLTRYNMYPAAAINGSARTGLSSGQAIDLMERLTKQELPTMAFEWTDMSYLEVIAGGTGMILFGFAVIMVFLVLAAQYESWSLPLAVILVVPMCLLSSIAGVRMRGMDINIFTQIGFVVLVGLASKNAILIVEFAKRQREQGVPRHEATLQACKLRLRPIIMTSFAFILGVVPLTFFASGAGAEMRRALGTAVFSGMLGVTLFGIFLTPVFFYVINRLSEAHLLQSRFMIRTREISLLAVSLGLRALRQLKVCRPRPAPTDINIFEARVHRDGTAVKVNGDAAAPAKAEEPNVFIQSGDGKKHR
jgi:multidrug efflux pump